MAERTTAADTRLAERLAALRTAVDCRVTCAMGLAATAYRSVDDRDRS